MRITIIEYGLIAALLGIAGLQFAATMPDSEAPAVEVRLIGECDGRIYAAKEESAFPAGCSWIDPIRYVDDNEPAPVKLGDPDSEFHAGRAWSRHAVIQPQLIEESN